MVRRLGSLAKGATHPFVVALVCSLILGRFVIGAVLERAGRPALPLDDAFIHFQFARRFAEGAPLRYTGDAASGGATSLVWPALLAPFWKLGARGLAIVWAAWGLGTVAHAGVAVDTGRLASRLAGRNAGIAAAAMCLVFGPFAWFAWSGMETMALAWILVRTARVASEVLDRDRLETKPFPIVEVALLGALAPFVRPEGALASAMAALALALRARGRSRALALVPIAATAALPLILWLATGDPTSSTARVKWLVYNPYYDAGRLAAQMREHARLLLFDVWNGGEWTWIFVPKGLLLAIFAGALALVRSSRRAPWTAGLTLALFFAAFATCSYQTFLWNRMRYVWPFAPAVFVMCACLARESGDLLRKVRAPLGAASAVIAAVIVARLAALLPDTIEDLAQSARAVDRQQAQLGEWVRANLPKDALVGVNDTGAIAYLGERRTFDIVGLTTPGAAAAWVAGAGSRYERFERMDRRDLPSTFLVYPEWFGCDALLGRELARRTVLDHAILGGDTMIAFEADFSLLGAGALPVTPPPGAALADEVDVADLDSEAAHGFTLGDAWDTDDVTRELDPSDAAIDATSVRRMVDGGREARARDTFTMAAKDPARGWILAMRVAADEPVDLRVLANATEIGLVHLPKTTWYEAQIAFDSSRIASSGGTASSLAIDVVAVGRDGAPVPSRSREGGPRFASFHYWLYAR